MIPIKESRIRIPAKPQRRGRLRRGVKVPCEVVAANGFRLLGNQAIDLSDRGLLALVDDDVEVGQSVFVSVKLPRGISWVDAEGEVVRVEQGRRDKDRGRAVGIKFTRMDASERAMLQGALETLPPTIPKRVPQEHRGSMILRIRD